MVHRGDREHGPKNLQRRVADFGRSAVFVWFSSHSAVNGRGSVMAYTVCSRHVDAWYAAFSDIASWRLARVKGISRLEIDSSLVALVGQAPDRTRTFLTHRSTCRTADAFGGPAR